MTTRKAAYSKARRHCSGAYRSGLEVETAKFLKGYCIDPQYEEHYLEYKVPESIHKYTPDFILPNGIVIETKGLWDAEDRKKHVLIKEQYPDLDIRFVFTRSKTPIYKGSKTTYASFCEKYNILYADKKIPLAWLREPSKDLPKGVLHKKRINK